jgi:hypothetical protein
MLFCHTQLVLEKKGKQENSVSDDDSDDGIDDSD